MSIALRAFNSKFNGLYFVRVGRIVIHVSSEYQLPLPGCVLVPSL